MHLADTINAIKGLVGVGGATILTLMSLVIVLVVALCYLFFKKDAVTHKRWSFGLVLAFLLVLLVTAAVLSPTGNIQTPKASIPQTGTEVSNTNPVRPSVTEQEPAQTAKRGKHKLGSATDAPPKVKQNGTNNVQGAQVGEGNQ